MTSVAIQTIDPYRRTINRAPEPEAPADDFTFADVLDIINPLQHIPLVGWIYREITGDTIKTPAAIAGGALFGGPVGFAGAILTAAFESLSGETPEEMASRLLSPPEQARGMAAYRRAAGLANG